MIESNNKALNDHGPSSVSETMQLVLLALIPGILVFIYQNGWGSIINLLLAMISAIAFEAVAQKLRNRSPLVAIADHSALVTAVLVALCLPPLIPWWIPVLATGFAILLAKHAFGGIGNNPFNPAMVGYACVLISFPSDLSLWLLQPDIFSVPLSDAIRTSFNGGLVAIPPDTTGWDALTGATALDQHRTLILHDTVFNEVSELTQGSFGARQGEWINLAFLAGGLWLITRRVISWHIPAGFLGALLISTLLHNLLSDTTLSIPVNMFGGATMLCAFFISTDPVSAAASNRGRVIYAALIGLLVYIIRTYGAYPDGVAFAVLLANCTVPAIDRMDIFFNRAKHGNRL